MSDYRATSRYAKSLLELAQEKGVLAEVHNDMLMFSKTCEDSRDFALMMRNPVIKHGKKLAILEAIFKGKVNDLTMSFFEIITRKNREAILPGIAKEFHLQYNVFNSIELAKVITAVPLTKELRSQIITLVQKASNMKDVELIEEVDEEIIGGFVLKIADRQIDDSLKSKIKALELKFSQNPYIKEF